MLSATAAPRGHEGASCGRRPRAGSPDEEDEEGESQDVDGQDGVAEEQAPGEEEEVLPDHVVPRLGHEQPVVPPGRHEQAAAQHILLHLPLIHRRRTRDITIPRPISHYAIGS